MTPNPSGHRPNTSAEAEGLFNLALSNNAEQTGDAIGPYTLIRPIGEGGFGRVWLAAQAEPLRREVALKVLKPGMDSDEILSRFRDEWKSLALMTHPGIAKVFDAGITPTGRPYFTMEYVPGLPITAYCDEHRLKLEERLRLFIKVCQAVQHAHQRGIIHRDLKPSNILVCLEDGSHAPRVIDFGTARALDHALGDRSYVTQLQQIIGTPGYMSPEQTGREQANDLDTRTDIYSLGAVLYEVLTGTLPVQSEAIGKMALDAALRHVRDSIPPQPSRRVTTLDVLKRKTIAEKRGLPSERLRHILAGDLDWITLKCLEKERQRRYDSVGGLAEDIRLHLEHLPVSARPPDRAYLLGRAIRRNRLAFALGAIALLALAATAFVSTLLFLREREARIQTDALRREAESASESARNARASAEDLIDWALNDLRGKLNSLGRLDLFDSLGGATQAYYQNLPPSERSRASDVRRARVLLLQGDVLYQRNELPKALGLYQEAITLLEPLPGDASVPDAKRWYSVLLSRTGDALFGHGKFDEALALRQRDVRFIREVLAAPPSGDFAHSFLCIALRKLAETLDRCKQFEAAGDTLQEALAVGREHAPDQVKMILHVRGQWEKRARDYQKAAATFGEAISAFDAMARESPDRIKELRYGVQCRISLADCLHLLDRNKEARETIDLAREQAERFNRIDPSNRDVHGDLVYARMVSANLHLKAGDEAAALADYRESLRIVSELSLKDPRLIFWQYNYRRLIRELTPLAAGPASSLAAKLLIAEAHLNNAESRHAAGNSNEASAQLAACQRWLEEIDAASLEAANGKALARRASALEDALRKPAQEQTDAATRAPN